MSDATFLAQPALMGIGALILAVLGVVLLRGGKRARRPDDVFTLLGTDPRAARKRPSGAPVDLSQPIAGEAQWRAIRAHARDAAYRRAVETVRNRYQVVANPMLLPNTLLTTMERQGIDFHEAMIRVAEDDGLR